MITYQMSPGDLKTFSVPGKPFLSFDQYLNVVQWYRDYHYAADNVADYAALVGKSISVWTVRQNANYHKHIWLDELKDELTISFEIPYLNRNATFPLLVKFLTVGGELVFSHFQELAVERSVGDKFVLTSWRRIPQLRDFLLKEVTVHDECHSPTEIGQFHELELAS